METLYLVTSCFETVPKVLKAEPVSAGCGASTLVTPHWLFGSETTRWKSMLKGMAQVVKMKKMAENLISWQQQRQKILREKR